MQLTFDDVTGSVYVYFSREPVARTEEISPDVLVDYDVHGAPRGVELLNATRGVDLDRVPRRSDVARLLEARNFPIFA